MENFTYICPISFPPEFKGEIEWFVYTVQLICLHYLLFPKLIVCCDRYSYILFLSGCKDTKMFF